MIKGSKTIKFNGMKVSPSRPTEAQLAEINKFTRRQFTADEMYIGQLRLAHNAIDRDNERFSEEILADFSKTAIRKTMLFDHEKYRSKDNAVGKFFDVEIEEMSIEEASRILNEELKLPDGKDKVMIIAPWYYIPVKGVSEEVLVKIDAGIYDFASIGFSAENCVPVFDKEGNVLFYEYRGKGETREGSLVYLGAQQGMAVKSHADKSAVSFSPTTPADEGRAWDAGAAKARLAKWASSDGSGDKDTIDWPKYRKGFAWYDSENPENIGSYKLPHHDVIDGEIAVVWNGVSASMGALLGARGGVDIPESDFDSVYNHLSKHYKQFDKEPPEKSAQFEENQGGKNKMKELITRLKMLFPGKTFSEENLHAEIKALLDEKDVTITGKDTAIAEKDKRIAELTPLAADGKAYRDDLISKYVAAKAKLGEVVETPEAQDKVKAVAAAYPIDFLKSEVDALQKRVDEKFPAEPQLPGDARTDKSGDGKDWKKNNPLVPKDETKEGK
jgi:hypothetical protein